MSRGRLAPTLRWLALVLALPLLGLAGPAPVQAHPAPFSYLDVRLQDGRIDGSLVVHVIDVAHDMGLPSPDILLDPKEVARGRQHIAALIEPRLELRTGRRLDLEWTEVTALPATVVVVGASAVPAETPERPEPENSHAATAIPAAAIRAITPESPAANRSRGRSRRPSRRSGTSVVSASAATPPVVPQPSAASAEVDSRRGSVEAAGAATAPYAR